MFTGELAWASNFDTTPFLVPSWGVVVKSNEHFFNAAKTLDPTERQWVLDAPTPMVAKRRGNSAPPDFTLRPGWDTGWRVRTMQTGLLAKFALPQMAERLAATGTMALVETNRWHDNFWGDCFCGNADGNHPRCLSPGQNLLGELLMALRCRVL